MSVAVNSKLKKHNTSTVYNGTAVAARKLNSNKRNLLFNDCATPSHLQCHLPRSVTRRNIGACVLVIDIYLLKELIIIHLAAVLTFFNDVIVTLYVIPIKLRSVHGVVMTMQSRGDGRCVHKSRPHVLPSLTGTIPVNKQNHNCWLKDMTFE